MVLYGTVWYCYVVRLCVICHPLSCSQHIHEWGPSDRTPWWSISQTGYLLKAWKSDPEKFQTSLLKILPYCYIYTINYIYIAFILWLHDVMSCYNMLRYLGLMRDDDLESSLLEGCVETSTCWMNCHGHMRKPSEDSAYSRLQAAIVSAVSFVALFSFFERCPMVFLWQDPSDPQRKRPCATSRLLASGHHSCRSPAVWAKAMVWNKLAK
jgi:hypothetical protein